MSRNEAYSRRTFLKGSAAAGLAILGGTLLPAGTVAAAARRFDPRKSPIKHLIIACQENRSFDHYFGYAQQA